MDTSRYINVFIKETKMNIEKINQILLKLKEKPYETELLKELYKLLHTIRTMSVTMEFDRIAELTHSMEDVVSKINDKGIEVNRAIFITISKGMCIIDHMLKEIESYKQDSDISTSEIMTSLNQISDDIDRQGIHISEHITLMEKFKSSNTITIDSERMVNLMGITSELIMNKTRLEEIGLNINDLNMNNAIREMGETIESLQKLLMEIMS